jgi:hypothetical protein
MEIVTHNFNGKKIAEVISEIVLIQNASDSLELLGNIYYQDFDKIILHQKNLTPEFFDLKNGLAGEMLQKFSNHRVRLAIVGDFSNYASKSITDFMFESNKMGQINFVKSIDEALAVLAID